MKNTSGDDEDDTDFGNLIIDLVIDFPDDLSDEQINQLKEILAYEIPKPDKEAVVAYYYKDKKDVVKELIDGNEEEEANGCIQQ